jgi:hypothetical protein
MAFLEDQSGSKLASELPRRNDLGQDSGCFLWETQIAMQMQVAKVQNSGLGGA